MDNYADHYQINASSTTGIGETAAWVEGLLVVRSQAKPQHLLTDLFEALLTHKRRVV